MELKNLKIGFALTGSFCTFDLVIEQIKNFIDKGIEVIPIMSENSYNIDSKFGLAKDFIDKIEMITGNKVLKEVTEVEPIGPKKMLDALVVVPCSSNTIGKLANGINDTPVTMAIKSQLRNERPVILGIATNDALSGSAMNIGKLLNVRNIYFIPFNQDDCYKKPRSMICDFNLTLLTIEEALEGRQIQPIIYKK